MSIRTGWSSFHWLLVVAFGLTCTATLAIGLTIWWMHSYAINDAFEDNDRLATVLAEQTANSIQSIDLVLTEIKDQAEIRSAQASNDIDRFLSDKDTNKILLERLSRLRQAEFIALVDKNGSLVSTTRQWPSPKVDLSDRDYFQYFKNNDDKGVYISNSLFDRIKGLHVIVFSKRINGANNTFLGVALAAVRLTYFQSIYKSIASMRDQYFLFLHRDGAVIVRYPDLTERAGEKPPVASPYHRLVSQGGGHYRSQSFFDGEARLVSVRPLRDYPLVVDIAESETAALATWRRQAITLGIGALLVMLCSAFLLRALSKQFHRVATSEAAVIKKSKDLEQTNALLQSAQTQTDAALNNMSQGLVMFDSENRLIVCNQRYLEMYGLSAEAFRPGRTLQEVIDCRIAAGGRFLDDGERTLADIRASCGQDTIYRKIMKLSDMRCIEIVNRHVADGGWVATHEDVTDKIQAEDVIRHQKQQLNATLENISQGVCMFDAAQRLVFCNKRYADLYELTSEQTKPGTLLRTILQHRISKGNAPKDHEAYIRDRLNEVSINKPYQAVNKLQDGRQISVVHQPMANGGWVATHEDITEIKRREESFRLLFEGNPVPMLVIDCESLCFLAVNEAAVKHYGYSREQFLSMTATDLQPTKDRENVARFVHALSDDQLSGSVRKHTKADGTIIDVLIYSRTLVYQGQKARLGAIHDITDRKRTEDDLVRANDKFTKQNIQFETALNNMAQGLLMFDRDNKLAVSNRRFADMFGVPWEKWETSALGMTIRQTMQLTHELNKTVADKNPAEILAAVKNMLDRRKRSSVVAERTDGRDLLTSLAPMSDGGFVATFDDITERRRKDDQILHMAHYDALTDLPNRVTFKDTLDATLNRSETTGEQFAVLSLDFDHFKETNDTYGHIIGDGLLSEAARRLRAAAGETFLARLGGDEFVLIGVNGTQPAAAAALAERLLATLADDFEVEGHRLKLGMSIGIAIYPTDGIDAKTLMINADAALYRAKAETRGMAMFFEPEMGARLHERYALQEDLRLGIDRGELLLHYQPQVKMSGEAVGFESLARWQCPKRGMVPPSTFIPIAEESSLILSLGEWVLREACREAASWRQPLTIAVNISPIQFRHGDLPRLVHSVLLETGLVPGRLELEITEGVMINDFSRAISILNRLKSLGVKIAMDDFGTGYSSLSYLQSFNCDKVKIDRIFICDLEHNYHSRSIVRAVISLGRSLNLPILAEGVETEAQHRFLVQEGCDEVQGYLTGRPLPIADYAKLVGRQAVVQKSYAMAG
jgi:diguanylate cyclase (GGDEF)-like protein/PAS domain S-box-containing protein